MPDTGNAKDCHPKIFRKTWLDELIWLVSQYQWVHSLRKHPLLLALHRWGRFAWGETAANRRERRNACFRRLGYTVQYCFLFRFVWIKLVSLIWFRQIWVAIYVYGTMINWSTLIKKLMQTYIVIVLSEYSKCFHCSHEWHLTPHMT